VFQTHLAARRDRFSISASAPSFSPSGDFERRALSVRHDREAFANTAGHGD
jgi:hypothetical protein